MPTFEQGFADSENAADSVLKALSNATTLARQLRRAAQDGNIAALRRTTERLEDSLTLIRQEIANAAGAWPFPPEAEQVYLQEQYAEELKEEARKKNLQMYDRDGRLIAHPSVLRVMPGERAVQINRRPMSAIRPTKIVAVLEGLQQRPPRFSPRRFLESLYVAYGELAGTSTTDRLKLGGVGQVIPLMTIYSLFTGLPGANRDYSQLDFASDLYSLEESGVKEVRSGARISFPSSARSSRAISFVGPDGEPVIYYGIQFTGGGK